MNRIGYFFRSLREKVWFYPVLYSLIAVLIAAVSVLLDMRGLLWTRGTVFSLILTDHEIGKTILGIIASSFITITTFTFSTTMVVLTMYTSQYSPRVVRNFLTQRETLQVFGVFVSGFLYVMIVLLFMSNFPPKKSIVSASIGIMYILVGIVYFFRFINNVASFIQAGSLIDRLKENALIEIDAYTESISKKRIVQCDTSKITKSLSAGKDGFIREYDYGQLKRAADAYGLQVYLNKVAGQFVTKHTVIGWFYRPGDPLSEEDTQEAAEKIMEGVYIGGERSEAQDFAFTIEKIVELAVKALSPGINDPNTAIHCIRITSLLLREVSGLPSGYILLTDDEDTKRASGASVCVEAVDFSLLLTNTYQQMVNYGRSDIAVMKEIIKSLRVIGECASDQNKRSIQAFGDYLRRKVQGERYDVLEVDVLEKELREFYDPPNA